MIRRHILRRFLRGLIFLGIIFIVYFGLGNRHNATGAIGQVTGSGTLGFVAKWVPGPPFDFSFDNQGNINVIKGNSVAVGITTYLISGTSQSTLFSVSITGSPVGVTTSFFPTQCNPACFTTLTINTTASTPIGTYNVTVTGTAGALTHQISFPLTVNAPLPPLVTLSANSTNIFYNTSTTLLWSVTGQADSCTANSIPPSSWSGSKSVSGGSESTGNLIVTHTYTLFCHSNANGDSPLQTLTVNVVPSNPKFREISP